MPDERRPDSWPSLTHVEAQGRARRLKVQHTMVELDLTRPEGQSFRSRTTIEFDSSGDESFCDFRGVELGTAQLNGVTLDGDAWQNGRIRLDGLSESNVLVVEGRMAFSDSGEGLHRHVDPADQQTYLYAMSFLDAAPRWFACFDQPDLKCTYEIVVSAPEDWTVIGNGPSVATDPGKWTIKPSQRLSSYFVTLVAGPYVSVSDHHHGLRLGVYARASLADQLRESADDVLTVTKRALDYYQREFAMDYPFDEYHQAFVPDFNAGAMENPGCVTIRDQLVFRGRSTHMERTRRAGLIAHEMAHMWFGNLVTMRWWDDLWLNESFAEYLAQRCCSETGDYPTWTDFGIVRKDWGSVADQSSSTHPVAGNGAEDAAAALQNFDGISYAKGAAVLKQLARYLGDANFIRGLRNYFDEFAYGNAEFTDLTGHWVSATGGTGEQAELLQRWVQAWLRTSGMDTLEVSGAPPEVMIGKHAHSDAPDRPHSITVGSVGSDGAVTSTSNITVTSAAVPVTVPGDVALIIPDLRDETWAKIRFGPDGWTRVESVLAEIVDETAVVVVLNALRDSVRDSELDPSSALDLLSISLPTVASEVVLTELMTFASTQLAGPYAQPADRADRRQRIAALAEDILSSSAAGSDRQLIAFRSVIRTSSDVTLLRRWYGGADLPDGIALDPELRWSLVGQIVVQTGDGALLTQAEQSDPSSAGRNHAARVRAGLPTAEAKRAAWALLTRPSTLSAYQLYATAAGFFDPAQNELTEPYIERYFAEIDDTAAFRTGWVLAELVGSAYPRAATTRQTLGYAEAALTRSLHPAVRRGMVDQTDALRRAVSSLEHFAGAPTARR